MTKNRPYTSSRVHIKHIDDNTSSSYIIPLITGVLCGLKHGSVSEDLGGDSRVSCVVTVVNVKG